VAVHEEIDASFADPPSLVVDGDERLAVERQSPSLEFETERVFDRSASPKSFDIRCNNQKSLGSLGFFGPLGFL
jgi:hypothetical protein